MRHTPKGKKKCDGSSVKNPKLYKNGMLRRNYSDKNGTSWLHISGPREEVGVQNNAHDEVEEEVRDDNLPPE